MKLIFANNYYYIRGGSERFFFDEMEMLKKNRHDVIPFSRVFEKNFQSKYSHFFAPPLEYENVPLLRKISAAIKLIYSFDSRHYFLKLLEDYNPDIIHAHNIYGRLTTSILDAAYKKKISVVMTLHDYKLICPSYIMLANNKICESCEGKKFYYSVIKRCHKNDFLPSLVYSVESFINSIFKKYTRVVKYFICPSKFSLNKHAEYGIPEEKLIHIPNFVNTDTINPNYNKGNYILFVGRLSIEKGILTLLKAVKGLNVVVRIVGDGPMRAEYETYARENKISNVIFEGYKSGEELRDFFRNAAFLIIPSEWYENAPMTILESFAYGKPVIGSNIGGIPEMVRHGESGLLFEMGNAEDLRTKIKEILSSPSKIIEMGQRARKIVEDEYNAEVHYKRLMEVYKRIS
jgi:glycosyltransferase involved in cell wall biosynthesis